jgi:hypothetical protein
MIFLHNGRPYLAMNGIKRRAAPQACHSQNVLLTDKSNRLTNAVEWLPYQNLVGTLIMTQKGQPYQR